MEKMDHLMTEKIKRQKQAIGASNTKKKILFKANIHFRRNHICSPCMENPTNLA